MEQKRDSIRDTALQHGWDWFKYHADQRLTLLRYYLILFGAVATAYYSTITNTPFTSMGAAIFGVIASITFYRLDQRVAKLIKLGEGVLDKEQEALENVLSYGEVRIVELAERNKSKFLGSFRQILRFLFFFGILIFSVAFVFAYNEMCRGEQSLDRSMWWGAPCSIISGPVDAPVKKLKALHLMQ